MTVLQEKNPDQLTKTDQLIWRVSLADEVWAFACFILMSKLCPKCCYHAGSKSRGYQKAQIGSNWSRILCQLPRWFNFMDCRWFQGGSKFQELVLEFPFTAQTFKLRLGHFKSSFLFLVSLPTLLGKCLHVWLFSLWNFTLLFFLIHVQLSEQNKHD